MKTDRDMLELAAKAAGYKVVTYCEIRGVLLDGRGVWFNSLADDGDALRLAVKLGLCVQPACSDDYDRAYAAVYLFDDCGREVLSAREPYGEGVSQLFATRRAITRAAAILVRSM